jgi:hypothetical protein
MEGMTMTICGALLILCALWIAALGWLLLDFWEGGGFL